MIPSASTTKIVFLCGSLQPGADGVGDYTRRLAGELIRKGHRAAIVALNDNYVDEKFEGTQCSEGAMVPVLRLPSALPAAPRFAEARPWIDGFNPEWLSLQLVLFAFHPKGLPFGLSKQLEKLGRGRKWHLMFHELWVGMAVNDSVKQKLLGRVQRWLIKRLINDLKPEAINTQCDLYVSKLQEEACAVKKLPLFSNIPVNRSDVDTGAYGKDLSRHAGIIRFVFFGGLHPQARLHGMIAELKKAEKDFQATYEFLYAGRNGKESETHLRLLTQQNIGYKVLGELGPKDISALLSNCTFGVSTTSPNVLQKSGTVAAMMEHGLPVICIGREVVMKGKPTANKQEEGIYFLEDIRRLISQPPVIHPANQLSAVAASFISHLSYTVPDKRLERAHPAAQF